MGPRVFAQHLRETQAGNPGAQQPQQFIAGRHI